MAGSIEKRGENTYRLVYACGYNLDGSIAKYTKTVHCSKKEAEIERANRRLLQLQEDLIERISDVNYMPLYINTSNNINVASEISRLEMLFGIYLQKSCTAKFIYGNDGNEFAKQFYEKYDEFITAFKFQIIEMKTILMNGKKDDNMKRLIDEQVEKIPMAYYIYSKSVNEVALKYYESEKEKLKLLKRGIL